MTPRRGVCTICGKPCAEIERHGLVVWRHTAVYPMPIRAHLPVPRVIAPVSESELRLMAGDR